jgi:hypothetical protein
MEAMEANEIVKWIEGVVEVYKRTKEQAGGAGRHFRLLHT